MKAAPPNPAESKAGTNRPKHLLVGVAATLLLLAFLAQCLDLGRRISRTVDEEGHLAVGGAMWANGDYRITFQNMFLAQGLAGWGARLTGSPFPEKARQTELSNEAFYAGSEYLFHSGKDPQRLLADARVMITLPGPGLAIVVFFVGGRFLAMAVP